MAETIQLDSKFQIMAQHSIRNETILFAQHQLLIVLQGALWLVVVVSCWYCYSEWRDVMWLVGWCGTRRVRLRWDDRSD